MLLNLETLKITGMPGISRILVDQMPIWPVSKLHTLNVYACDDLRHVATSNPIKLLRSLETLDVANCTSLEAVFDFRGINIRVDMESLLDRLQSLELDNLPDLTHICRMFPKKIHAFKNLRTLEVWKCHNLKYLLSSSMAKMLVGLETLQLVSCKAMEAMIGRDERLISEIESEEDTMKKRDGEESAQKIQFLKLRPLRVASLENFQMLCSENIDLEFPSLTELVIGDCPRMTKFCVGRPSATRLHNVQVIHYIYDDRKFEEKNVALADFNSWLKDCKSGIRCLKCSFFEKETCKHFG